MSTCDLRWLGHMLTTLVLAHRVLHRHLFAPSSPLSHDSHPSLLLWITEVVPHTSHVQLFQAVPARSESALLTLTHSQCAVSTSQWQSRDINYKFCRSMQILCTQRTPCGVTGVARGLDSKVIVQQHRMEEKEAGAFMCQISYHTFHTTKHDSSRAPARAQSILHAPLTLTLTGTRCCACSASGRWRWRGARARASSAACASPPSPS